MSGSQQVNTLTDTVELKATQPTSTRWARYGSSTYLLGERIAAGGMGTVHLGLKQGALGFRRLLAIKRLHGHLAHEADFVARFKDEIRLVSRLNHPNVVQILDVLEEGGELALVMEFVEGVTLHTLLHDARLANVELPAAVAVGIVSQALHGLHSAHELVDDDGHPLHLVHRDVSPQNIIVARDGVVKVLDFGVAKASCEIHVTRTGQISGKASYMSPEQIVGSTIDRRTDIFAAGVVLWEALTGQRLFRPPGTPESAALRNVLDMRVKPPGELRRDLSPVLERAVLRALDRDPRRRFGSARDFALALEDAVPEASACSTIASGVVEISGARLAQMARASAARRVEPVEPLEDDSGVERAEPSALTRAGGTAPISLPASFSDPTTQALELKSAEPELFTSDVPGVPMVESPRRLWPRLSVTAPSIVAIVAALVGLFMWQGERLWTSDEVKRAQAEQAPPQPHAEPMQQAQGSSRSAQPVNPPPTHALSSRTPSQWSVPAHSTQPGQTPKHVTASKAPRSDDRTSKLGAIDKSATGQDAPQVKRTLPAPASPKRKTTVNTSSRSVADAKCSPPTYTDADGIRHFKPECL